MQKCNASAQGVLPAVMLERLPQVYCVKISFGLLSTKSFVFTIRNSMLCKLEYTRIRVCSKNTRPQLKVTADFFWDWRCAMHIHYTALRGVNGIQHLQQDRCADRSIVSTLSQCWHATPERENERERGRENKREQERARESKREQERARESERERERARESVCERGEGECGHAHACVHTRAREKESERASGREKEREIERERKIKRERGCTGARVRWRYHL